MKDNLDNNIKASEILKHKRILVYGTGKIANKLIINLKERDVKVIAILDKVKVSGFFMGIPIIEWRDLPFDVAEAIFIATPSRFYKEIYFRILPFCIYKGIKILDADGNSLMQSFGIGNCADDLNRYCLDKIELKKKINEYDIISFDVFDTLLVRNVVNPLDVFSILEKKSERYIGFRKYRREAEIECPDGSINQIYKNISSKMSLTDYEALNLQEQEFKLEQEVLTVKTEIRDIFEYAKSKNKLIIIVSDMYYPQEIIKTLLQIKGYHGFKDVFVSCDYHKSKTNGLFGEVRAKYKHEKILHIGDDKKADIYAPQHHSIDSIGVLKSIELYKKSCLGRYFGQIQTVEDSIWIGKIINNLFSNPFSDKNIYGDLIINKISDFVDLYFEPLISIYLDELEDALSKKCYDKVLFVSRDGYILQKCYDRLKSKNLLVGPKSEYIICSRKIAMRTGMKTKKELETILNFYSADQITKPLKKIFGIECKEKLSIAEMLDQYNVIEERIEQNSKNYKAYLYSKGIDFSKNYILCELDGHGTTAYYLNNLFENNLDSFYLERLHTQNEYEIGSIAVYDIFNKDTQYSSIFNNIAILENLFTSYDPSACDINEEGKFIYEQETRTNADIELLKKIHKEAEKKVLNIFIDKKEKKYCNISKHLISNIFDTLSEIKFSEECQRVIKWKIKDEITNLEVKFRGQI